MGNVRSILSARGVGPSGVGRFPPPATLGEIAGGLAFVAVLKHGLARPGAQTQP
jgi:hypothetical protein